MARRKKSSFNPWILIGAVALLGTVAGGYLMMRGKSSESFSGTTRLDPTEYVTNAMSMQGNTYQVTAKVKDQLRYTDSGRLYAMEAKDEKNGQMVDLSMLFPASLASESIQVGQELTVKVQVERNAILRVLELKRS